MSKKDTVNLLKETSSGIKMAVDSIDEVLPNIKNEKMREFLLHSKTDHEKLGEEAHEMLMQLGKKDEEPGMVAKSMSWMKMNMKMTMEPGDDTIADLMSSGCDMGVRSLNKYLNQYNQADDRAKDLAERVISLEEQLSKNLRSYL